LNPDEEDVLGLVVLKRTSLSEFLTITSEKGEDTTVTRKSGCWERETIREEKTQHHHQRRGREEEKRLWALRRALGS